MTRAREAMLRLFPVGDNRAAAIEPMPAILVLTFPESPHDARKGRVS